MKTLRIPDETHRKLTATLGTLTAQTGKMQTYQDAIEALLNCSITLQPELLAEVERYVDENKSQGYIAREEFIAEATRLHLRLKSKEYKYIEVPREKYEKLNQAIKEMSAPFHSVEDFISRQISEAIEKYEVWIEENENVKRKPKTK